MDAAEAQGVPMTFGEAIREADKDMRGMINEAQNPRFKDSKYYIDPSENGGFMNLSKEQNVYPYLEQNNVKDIIETIRAEEKKDAPFKLEKFFFNKIICDIFIIASSLKHPFLEKIIAFLFNNFIWLQFSSIIIPQASVPGTNGNLFLY